MANRWLTLPGYSGVRGLNALLGIVSTTTSAPIIIGSRLRKGAAGTPRGAGTLVGDVLGTVRRLRSASASAPGPVLLRADSAFYGHAVVAAAHRAGAKVSITARMDPAVKRTIGTIADDTWTTIHYTDAIRDETTGTWISSAEVTEVAFTAFVRRKKSERIEGRLVVRRIPELNRFEGDGQPTLFDTHHHLQPLPRHRHAHRHRARQSAQRHNPPQTDQHLRTNLDLGPETRASPAKPLTLASRVANTVHGGLRPTENRDHLTTQPNGATGPGTPPAARPDLSPCPPP